MNKEQLLYQYFSNTLTPEQEQRFNELLATDTEFKEQFIFEQDLQHAIGDKERKDRKAKLKRFEADIEQKRSNSPKRGYQKWAMAASIALLVGLGWFGYTTFFATDYKDLYEANFQQYPNTVYAITRGSEEDNSVERKAFEAYEANDNASAIGFLEELRQTGDLEYVDFYLAQSYLNDDQPKKAIPLLARIVKDREEFAPEALWYMALAHLRIDEKKNAEQALKDLVADGRYKKDEAEILLEKLE